MTNEVRDIGRYISDELLHLVLMPTEACNFRCVYCYEDFEHGRMPNEVIEGVKSLLSSRIAKLHLLSIQWFGGEPLLAVPVIEEVMHHVRDTAQRLNPKLMVRSGMTTNGYLLDRKTLARLIELEVVSYQISLDGTAESHDARRIRADGEGTFGRILANLRSARDTDLDFSIRLRIHVDKENLPDMHKLLHCLGEELGHDARFEANIRPIGRFGGKNDAKLPVLEEKELGVIDELKMYASQCGLRMSVESNEPCYAATANSFVIRATGEIGKCTVSLRHPNNRLGILNSDGTASVDHEKFAGWVRGLFSGKKDELQCPMKGFAPVDEGSRPTLPVLS